MIKKIEKQRLKNYVEKSFKNAQLDYQVFDVDSEIDDNISYRENKNQMTQKLDILFPYEKQIKPLPHIKKSKVIQVRLNEELYKNVITFFKNKNLSEFLRNTLFSVVPHNKMA